MLEAVETHPVAVLSFTALGIIAAWSGAPMASVERIAAMLTKRERKEVTTFIVMLVMGLALVYVFVEPVTIRHGAIAGLGWTKLGEVAWTTGDRG